jgi:EAL and modified HD-GYP domain-containing signal transduction protein
MPASVTVSAQILAAVRSSPLDLRAVETLLKRDLSLVDRLLRLLNGAAMGWRQPITSLHHGLVLLGETQVRRWVSLLALTAMTDSRPSQLNTMSLVRAHMCESLGGQVHAPGERPSALDHYLTGMYSLIDVLLGQEMESVLAQLPLSAQTREALVYAADNPLRRVLDVVVAYERGEWDRATALGSELGLEELTLAAAHLRALVAIGEADQG